MSYFAVTRNAGPAWSDGKGAFEQPGISDHTAFMNTLAEEDIVVFAGPLAGTEQGSIRVLLIAEAPAEADIRHRLAGDPWELTRKIVTTTVELWNPFVGAQRLTSAPAAAP
jgi:uncharacterized protein YciI